MSRGGKMPIPVPQGVEVQIAGRRVSVKGPKGELSREIEPDMRVEQHDGQLVVTRPSEQPRHRAGRRDARSHRAIAGEHRARAALAFAAAVFRACQAKHVAEHCQEPRVCLDVHLVGRAVDDEC